MVGRVRRGGGGAVFALTVLPGFAAGVPSVAVAAPVMWSPGSGGNGHYYDYVPTYLSWQQAKVAAEGLVLNGLTGRLATVNSAAEKDFIAGALGTPEGWLGGFQDRTAPDYSEPGGGWRWITGEAWSYTNWFPGFPDEYLNHRQDFLRAGGSALWDDIENDPGVAGVQGYFVEYVPEPVGAVPVVVAAGLLGRRRRGGGRGAGERANETGARG